MAEKATPGLPKIESPMIVDLFAGPGGLDVGAHWLGVPSIGIEFDESAVDTREAAGLSSILADVTTWRPEDFTDAVNVLTGGPPCQTFTVAGNGHGRKALTEVIALVEMLGEGTRRIDDVLEIVSRHEDVRTGLVLQPLIWALRAIEAGRPFQAILLEQVPAVRPVWEAMAKVLQAHGYGTDVDVLRTEEYGVPQTRRRAVMAARFGAADDDVEIPEGTHQRYISTAFDAPIRLDPTSDKPRWISMSDVLGLPGDLELVSNYGSGGDPKNRCRRKLERPAFTVTGKVSRNKIAQGKKTLRSFNWSEAGRLQTFPTDYPWDGADISQQIGNAIPPRLGAHVLNWLLGIGPVLDDEFFADKGRQWVSPSNETALSIRASIASPGVLGESITKIIGPPLRMEGSVHDESPVLGIGAGRSEVDAVESEPGYGAGTAVAV